ncbi:MAG: DM13 domain-containing protein [Chloroflexota bacterium]
MNNQLRVLSVLLGAIVVVATYTFPLWQPYLGLIPGRSETAVLGLPPELSEQISLLPPGQLAALRELAEEDPDMARSLAIAQISRDDFVDEEEPTELGQQRVILGDFVPADDVLQAEGQLTIYETANGDFILRLDNLDVTNIDGLSIYFSGQRAPLTGEEMQQDENYYRLIELRGNAGNQNYNIAPEVDLDSYNSVVIYSEALDIVVGYAAFTTRL